MFRFFFHLGVILAVSAASTGISNAQVLINEYMPDPARDWDGDGEYNYRNDEWVEIINTGSSSIDLTGFLLRDGGDQLLWRYGFSGELAPGRLESSTEAMPWHGRNQTDSHATG